MDLQKFFAILLLSFSIKLLLTPNILAQLNNETAGGRSWAMANASTTLQDGWAIYNNVGGLANVERIEVFGGYQNRFGLSAFQTFSIGAVAPLSFGGVIGMQISRFGDEIYSEQKLGFAYSHQISGVSLGLKINYVQVSLQDLGSAGNFTFEFGGVANIIPKLAFAAHIYNFSQASLKTEYASERLPVLVKAGLAYQPIPSLLIVVETEKDVDFPALLKTGIEYEVVPQVFLRTGIQTQTFSSHFGVGFHPKNFQLDYALVSQNQLGLTHYISFLYGF